MKSYSQTGKLGTVRDAQEQFGRTAENYLTSAVHANEAALARIVEVVRPDGGRVLDVATGAGHTAFALAPHVEKVIATDLTGEMLRVTRRTAAERSLPNVEVAFSAAEALPFANGVFDGVTCRMAAHHFTDVDAFLKEAHRVIAPNGWLLLIDNVGVEDDEADAVLDRMEFLRDRSHVRYYRESVWEKLFKRHLFAMQFCETIPKPINAKDWMDRMHVPEEARDQILKIILESSGLLRSYLRPHGEGDLLTFHLNEMLAFCRRR
jgi:ubiquinone/menaquinone biosynthesis C-methylase UbiE